jgi:hypothetical protein
MWSHPTNQRRRKGATFRRRSGALSGGATQAAARSPIRGQRCRERAGLEVHHEHAFALGGATTVENLRLLCRAHNGFLAERDFGRAQVERMRMTAGSQRT